MICSYHKYASIRRKISEKSKYFDFLLSLPYNENIENIDEIIFNLLTDSDESNDSKHHISKCY